MPIDLEQFRDLLDEEEVRSISRRYFFSNGFDGTLTSIGVAMGSYLSGVPDGVTVFAIGVGAAVGLGTSGVWSVWEIERAEKLAEIKDLEAALLTDLDDTALMRQKEGARLINAISSGIGPLIGILLPMSPYLLEGSILTMLQATLVAVALGMGVLFMFGAYMGSIGSINPIIAGIRMGLAGLVVAIINLILPG